MPLRATKVNRNEHIRPTLSPKLRRPIARPQRTTLGGNQFLFLSELMGDVGVTHVKFNHERKVRSFAKKTLGSTRVGSAIRLPVRRLS